jgi:Isochorismatase family
VISLSRTHPLREMSACSTNRPACIPSPVSCFRPLSSRREQVALAITATGRKKLILAGISLEVCAALPAITAVGKGLDAYVAVDASGTFSETKRQVGLLRMLQAGVTLSDYATLMVEILKDNARPEARPVYRAIDMPWAKLVGQIAPAYGKVIGTPVEVRSLYFESEANTLNGSQILAEQFGSIMRGCCGSSTATDCWCIRRANA